MEDFIKYDDDNAFTGKVLILDSMNLAYKNAFVCLGGVDGTVLWDKWRCRMVSDIMEVVDLFSPDRFIIAMDSEENWRKLIYPEYKGTRHKDSKVNRDDLGANVIEFFDEFAKAFTNFRVARCQDCEADDVIATLTFEYAESASEVIIISADKDFCQLHTHKNVTQYTPLGFKPVEILNPKFYLDLKIITGCDGDNIKPIKFGIGPKKAQAILSGGIESFLSNNAGTDLAKNYDQNKLLIDFESIPDKYSKLILEQYNSIKTSQPSGSDLFEFFDYTHSTLGYNRYKSIRDKFQRIN